MLEPKIDLYIVAIPPPRDSDWRANDFTTNPLGFNSSFCFITLSTKPCFSHKKDVNTILVAWLECRFLVTEVDGSNPGKIMLIPWARYFICIASVDSAVKWVPGGDNLVKDVQCYELFWGIALKNHAFSLSFINVGISQRLQAISLPFTDCALNEATMNGCFFLFTPRLHLPDKALQKSEDKRTVLVAGMWGQNKT